MTGTVCFLYEKLEVDAKEILDKKSLPREVYEHLERHDLPRYQWTAIDPVTSGSLLNSRNKNAETSN